MVLLTQIARSIGNSLSAVALTLLAGAAIAADLEQREWRDVRSTNFQIMSVLSEARTIELLRHLEIMHSTFGSADATPTFASGMPAIIIAVDDHDEYVRVGAPANTAGYFFSDLRENAILIEDTPGSPGIQVILHEYAHYLSKQTGRMRYPRWYEEGHAEYLSHSRIGDNSFEYGLPADIHIANLNFAEWLPLSTILDVTDTASIDDFDGELFYAQSWLLVHYLHSLPDSERMLPVHLRDYARLTSGGSLPTEAFEQAFGIRIAELQNVLLHYFLEQQFSSRRVPADTALPGFSTRTRPMSTAEAQLALARMALRFDNVAGAQQWFENVLRDDELRAHAEAGLGRIAGLRGDVATASKHFESAIYLMAWDFNIWMDYAQYWAQRVSTSYTASDRDRNASRLIESLESALTIAKATPELNSLMGFAYLAKGKDPFEAIEFLETAAAAAPHDQASRLLLANAYLYVGRLGDARRTAEAVLSFEHEPNLVTTAAHEVINKTLERDAR